MVGMIAVRPGYVYVMANPSLPGWHKVGHTHRPPHRRASELSRTSVPTAFDVAYARFFWDAQAAERVAHRHLARQAGQAGRRKEFFRLPLEKARGVLLAIPDAGYHRAQAGPPQEEDVPWEDTLEGRESLWEWAEQDWGSGEPQRRRDGWRAMERLSAAGWGEGSWRLSELLVRQDMSLAGGERAAWVLDAAHAQGLPEAALRAAWLRSWAPEPEAWQAWTQALDRLPSLFGQDPAYWPERVLDTLRAEQALWPEHPHRRLTGAWVTAGG